MKTITIHYTTPYIGTIAKQGEHNQTELVFYLPDSFNGADFVNAEFVKRDDSTSVVDHLVPNNGTVTVPMTQDLTNVDGKMEIQLVAYKVDGTEITEIAKSGIYTCKIRKSLNVLFGEDQPGVIERIIAFIAEWASKLPEMWSKMHTHQYKRTLDELYCQNVEDPPEEPGIYIHGENYLRFDGKFLRYTRDGSVINRVTTVTKNNQLYLRLFLEWTPEITGSDNLTGKPSFVDIPVDSATTETEGQGEFAVNGTVVDLGIGELEAARSNWDENDSDDIEYIKNRTHWKEESQSTESYSFTSEYDSHDDEWVWEFNGDEFVCELVEGKTYTITYDDNEYEFVATKVIDIEETDLRVIGFAIGNTDILNDEYEPSVGDFPFCISYAEINEHGQDFSESDFLTIDSLHGTTVSFSVSSSEVEYHKLSTNYIPDSVVDAVEKKHTHINKEVIDRLGAANRGSVSYLLFDGELANGYAKEAAAATFSGQLKANCFTMFGSSDNPAVSITITGYNGVGNGATNEFVFAFYSGSTPTTLTLPASVEWADELTVEANKRYQVSILDNVALWCAVDVEVEE